MLSALPETLHEAWLYARAAHVEHIAIESAGLFWLGAELAILYAMLAARGFVSPDRPGRAVLLSARDRRRAAVWSVAFVVLCFAVLLRHRMLTSAPGLIGQEGAAHAGERVIRIFTQRNREHLAVWAAFVTGWVVLEMAIVYQGWRIYQIIRERFGSSGGGRVVTIGFAVVLHALLAAAPSVCAGTSSESGHELLRALHAAREAEAPYRNALYLYLRIAGVGWIAVEWLAAILLYRGFRILRRAAETNP